MDSKSDNNDSYETSIFSGSNIITTIQFIISIACIVYFTKMYMSKNSYSKSTSRKSRSKTITNNHKVRKLCIITDPDDEIDDEIALYHMFEEIKKSKRCKKKKWI